MWKQYVACTFYVISLPISCTHCTSIQTHGFMGMHVSGELQVEINTPAFYFNNCTFKWTWHLFECDFPICARTLLSAFSFFLLLMFLLLLIFKWKVDTNVRVVLLWTSLHAEKRKFKEKPIKYNWKLCLTCLLSVVL